MKRELRFYLQSRLTEQGFSKNRTPEDTEFTSLAATKMILTEQFSLTQRIQTLLERIDPAVSAAERPLADFASSGKVNTGTGQQSLAFAAEQRETAQSELDATLQALLQGQEEILSREAKTALALRRIQDTLDLMHSSRTHPSTTNTIPSEDVSALRSQPSSESALTRPRVSSMAARGRRSVRLVQRQPETSAIRDQPTPPDLQEWQSMIREQPVTLEGSQDQEHHGKYQAVSPVDPSPNGRRDRRIVRQRSTEGDSGGGGDAVVLPEAGKQVLNQRIAATSVVRPASEGTGVKRDPPAWRNGRGSVGLLPEPLPEAAAVDHHLSDPAVAESYKLALQDPASKS